MTIKDLSMLLGLAAAFAIGIACFGLSTENEPAAGTTAEKCAGLSGQAKIDCEQRQAN